MNWIDQLNEIADRINEHVEAAGGILDDSDHDEMTEVIEEATDYAQYGVSDEFWAALDRAKRAMQNWNDEEYPYLEDILSDMHPEGIDDGCFYYDED